MHSRLERGSPEGAVVRGEYRGGEGKPRRAVVRVDYRERGTTERGTTEGVLQRGGGVLQRGR